MNSRRRSRDEILCRDAASGSLTRMHTLSVLRWPRFLPLVAAVCAAVLSSACARNEDADGPDSVPDEAVIDGLRDAGSDLSKAHDVDFNLYFPNEAAARRFADKLAGKPFEIAIDESEDEWSVQATKKMRLTAAEIQATTEELTALAEAEGGELDGWGASVVY